MSQVIKPASKTPAAAPAAAPAAKAPAATAAATTSNGPTNTKPTPPAGNAAPKAAAPQAPAAQQEEAEVAAEQNRMMSRKLVWGLAACGSSMVVHLALLLVLGLTMLDNTIKKPPPSIQASVQPEREQEEITQKLEQKIQPATELNPSTSVSASAASSVGVAGAISSAVTAPKMATAVVDRPTSMRVDVGAVNVFTASGGTFAAAVPDGTLGDGIATATGYGDAMDRMTQEILNMLAKRKVLVTWVMDQSESMEDDRIEITGRIERVYQELGLSSAAKDDALMTTVISYGATTMNHTPQPTYKAEEIMAAIRSVPNDPSGAEMQCQAVQFSLATFAKYAQSQNRQMAMIIVSDESGDMNTNISQLEQTIAGAKSVGCKIYVLGRESVFGYPYAWMRYFHEETKTNHWLRIDRGPETPWPEQLQIDGFHARHDAFPSGFGPYEQSRMARETGGIFFMLPSPEVNLVGRRADLVYDADAMRPYLPDLSDRRDYESERDKSQMRAVVWKVIVDLNPYDKTHGSKIGVQTSNFSIDRAKFATQAQTQMKRAQDMIMYLQAAQKAMETVAPLKAREVSPRWRANYELIYAQTLAYQARLQEYGWYLAEFMKTPKPITNNLGPARPTNEWNVGTVKRLLKPEITQPLRDKADELFREVVKNHPGTPWSARAEIELKRGYGIELYEGFEDPASRGSGIKLPKY
jgi:hypothetical protein